MLILKEYLKETVKMNKQIDAENAKLKVLIDTEYEEKKGGI